MRLAVIGDEISQDPAVVADLAVRHGFPGVEIRSAWGCAPHLMSDGQLREVARVLRGQGREVAGFASPVFKHALPVTDREFEEASRLLHECLRRAELIGAPTMRIFAFYRDGDPDPVVAGHAARRLLDGVPPRVPLVVETGTRTNTPSVRHLLEFLEVLDRPDIGVLWDPGNSVFSGWEPSPFPREYEAVRDLIRHVHVKDPAGQDSYVRLGEGDLAWTEILGRLAEDDFEGYVSLETHWRTDRILTAGERDEPWGEGFSTGGAEASAVCMELLSEWYHRATATATATDGAGR
ncbi:sugar phosphate isomerase/epimerase family protein [Nocardiopsis sp. NPDC006832]|uniref:sugar phosphate isomerase/epimerase family protein n=1 Tax=Nocardiopsis sp. NPDC006832 TaxID=3157188 RepID=UPI0033FC3AE8